jgi:HNH endonuclease
MGRIPRSWTFEEFFWSRVNKSGPTVRRELGPCWLWTGSGASNPTLYGRVFFRDQYQGEAAHRISLQMTGVDIGGKDVCHRCDNPPCVRPSHLFPGTRKENMQDAATKGRIKTGAKLTAEQVIEIRKLRTKGLKAPELATMFDVTEWAIYDVLRGRNWKGVERPNAEYEKRRETHCSRGHERAVYGYRSGGTGQWMCRPCARDRRTGRS